MTSPRIVEGLRKTLEKLEQSAQVKPDDPALLDLKHRVLLLIAKLEGKKSDAA